MTQLPANIRDTQFGFIQINKVPDVGHCGGLLMLNSLGRPIEFHCTAPVRENRAQRILYGKTYDSFLYCEQISLALLGKTKKRPHLLFVSRDELWPLHQISEAPVLLTKPLSQLDSTTPHSACRAFEVHDFKVFAPRRFDAEFEQIQELCLGLTNAIPVDEPFERITQAIEEAQAVVR